MSERIWAMQKIAAGDWICLSNDRSKLWRFHTYVDGAAHGLCYGDGTPVRYQERTFWRAVWVRWGIPAYADPATAVVELNPWEPPWVEADWRLPTRQAAVELMLRDGETDGRAA